jgi:hypothetical protein
VVAQKRTGRPTTRRSRVVYRDAEGRETDEPREAVQGEILDYGHGRPVRRIRFFLDRKELPWLPVSEPAFLLWVLVGLFFIWSGIAIFLTLT